MKWQYYLWCLLCLPLTVWAQQGEALDKIIATVDHYIVLKSELEARLADMAADGRVTPESKCRVLEQLIIQKMMLAKAEIDSVVVEEKQIQAQLDQRMKYILGTIGNNEKKLEELYGKTINDLKMELYDAIREQMTVQKMQGKITEGIKITPKEVRRFYADNKDSIPYIDAEVEIAHIVKMPELNREQRRKTREKAEAIRQRILNGEKFEDLAMAYSEDPGSGKEGGYLNWQQRGNFVPEFEAVAFKLKPKEISKVTESPFGFHIIQLLDRRGNEFETRHILIKPDYAEVDVEQARHFLDSIRTRIIRDSTTFAKAAKDFSEDKPTASNAGVIQGEDGGARIPLGNIDPFIYEVIDTMKVGQISRPLPYRTDEGKMAVRLIYYKARTEPHSPNLKDDYLKLQNYALNEKKNKAIEEWFRRTRDQVFIDIDPEYKDCEILKWERTAAAGQKD